MKKIIYLIFLLAVFVSVANAKIKVKQDGEFSCQTYQQKMFCTDAAGKPLTGKLERRDENGTRRSIENYKNGWQSGLTTRFDEDGNLERKTYYKEGIKNGIERIYYSNRTIKEEANYKNGMIDGRVDQYTPSGELLGRMTYKQGRLTQGYCTGGRRGKKEKFKAGQIQQTGLNKIVSCGEAEE